MENTCGKIDHDMKLVSTELRKVSAIMSYTWDEPRPNVFSMLPRKADARKRENRPSINANGSQDSPPKVRVSESLFSTSKPYSPPLVPPQLPRHRLPPPICRVPFRRIRRVSPRRVPRVLSLPIPHVLSLPISRVLSLPIRRVCRLPIRRVRHLPILRVLLHRILLILPLHHQRHHPILIRPIHSHNTNNTESSSSQNNKLHPPHSRNPNLLAGIVNHLDDISGPPARDDRS